MVYSFDFLLLILTQSIPESRNNAGFSARDGERGRRQTNRLDVVVVGYINVEIYQAYVSFKRIAVVTCNRRTPAQITATNANVSETENSYIKAQLYLHDSDNLWCSAPQNCYWDW